MMQYLYLEISDNKNTEYLTLTICGALRVVQFRKRENTHGGVLILVKLAKINTPPWVFFKFFKLYKWYRIVQHIT